MYFLNVDTLITEVGHAICLLFEKSSKYTICIHIICGFTRKEDVRAQGDWRLRRNDRPETCRQKITIIDIAFNKTSSATIFNKTYIEVYS
jgi:hypothetical protein